MLEPTIDEIIENAPTEKRPIQKQGRFSATSKIAIGSALALALSVYVVKLDVMQTDTRHTAETSELVQRQQYLENENAQLQQELRDFRADYERSKQNTIRIADPCFREYQANMHEVSPCTTTGTDAY